MRRLLAGIGIVLVSAAPAAAQAPLLAPPRFDAAAGRMAQARPMTVPPIAQRDGGTPVPLLVGAGILGGGVGLVGGAFVGAWGGDFSCEDDGNPDSCEGPVLLGAVIGGIAGEALLLPLAEHLAGGRRGPFVTELLVSAGLAALGLGLLHATGYEKPAAPVILVATPVAQLAAVTALERR